MPMIAVQFSTPAPRAGLTATLARAVNELSARILHKNPAITAVVLEEIEPSRWFIGNRSLAQHSLAAFWLDIRIAEGTNTREEKAAFVAAAFEKMQELIGALHPESYVHVNEVRGDAYGYGGLTQNARYFAEKPHRPPPERLDPFVMEMTRDRSPFFGPADHFANCFCGISDRPSRSARGGSRRRRSGARRDSADRPRARTADRSASACEPCGGLHRPRHHPFPDRRRPAAEPVRGQRVLRATRHTDTALRQRLRSAAGPLHCLLLAAQPGPGTDRDARLSRATRGRRVERTRRNGDECDVAMMAWSPRVPE